MSFNSKFVTVLLLFLIWCLCASSIASGQDFRSCPELQKWLNEKAHLKTLLSDSTAIERANSMQAEWSERVHAAEVIFQHYTQGTLNFKGLNECLKEQDNRGDFWNTLSRVFFEETIGQLRTAQSPSVQKLIASIDQRTQRGQAPIFKLVSEIDIGTTTLANAIDPRAGFSRESHSIFADIEVIAPNEWPLIFIHEFTHAFDERLMEATREFSNSELIKNLAHWAQKTDNPSVLPPDLQQSFRAWLQAGLDRGLWAEWRAWMVTFIVYDQLIRENFLQPIFWMEKVFGEYRTQTLPFDHFLYVYLDSNFTDPTTSVFVHPLFKNGLKQIREEYVVQKKIPPMGELEKFTFNNSSMPLFRHHD